MDRMDYIQAVSRTRVLEKKLLSRARIDRMIDAKDIEEVFKALNETEYSSAVSETKKGQEYEEILSKELQRVYATMREVTVDQIIVDLMALKYDYHNLKVLFKEKLLNKDLSELYNPIGVVDFERVKECFLEGNHKDMEKEYREAIEAVAMDYEVKKDPQRIDIIIDGYYYKHLTKMAQESGIELFIEYVKDRIDFINIRSSIRLKKQEKEISFFEDVIIEGGNIDRKEILYSLNDSIENMIHKFRNYNISPGLTKGLESYKETKQLSDFEKYMDNYLMDLNKPSKHVNFGPEPIFSYIAAKESEIKTLRMIMVAKMNHISPDVIRERVRDLYV